MPSEINIPNLINIKEGGVSKGLVDKINFAGGGISAAIVAGGGVISFLGYDIKNIVQYTTPGSGTYNPPSDVEALLITAVGGGGGGGSGYYSSVIRTGGAGGGAGGCGIKLIKRPFIDMSTFASTSTNGGHRSALVLDSSGNLYWAVNNFYNGSTWNLTSYVYKITPGGTMTTFASASTNGSQGVDLAWGPDGNLYWAVGNRFNGSTNNLTSYVYKITPSGTMTTFASVSTVGAQDVALVWGPDGNLYWAVTSWHNGSTYNLTSYVYKVTPQGNLSTFASANTSGSCGTDLVFDSSGNLYWAVMNSYNGSTYDLTSYVYKITPGGTMTTFASTSTYGALETALVKDSSDNLYWAVVNAQRTGPIYNLTSYVYKITPSGTMTTFASVNTSGGNGTNLVWDSGGNLYWAVTNHYNGSYNLTSYVYKVTPQGNLSTLASTSTNGGTGTDLIFDSSNNLYWSTMNYYSGSYNLTSYVYKISQITSFPYTIGAGGAGGSGGGSNVGGNGGSTTIAGIVAGGGVGGRVSYGTHSARGGSGGTASGGDINFPGNVGHSSSTGFVSSTYGSGGTGGDGVFGGAGCGGGSSTYGGDNGSFGGGGGGGSLGGSGGNGGNGIIVIYELG